MDAIRDNEDRVAQCDWLRDIALYIADGMATLADSEAREWITESGGYTARAGILVADWERDEVIGMGETLPDWYDQHDRDLLASWVAKRLEGKYA